MRHRLEIGFPPSVNKRLIIKRGGGRMILSKDTRRWLKAAALEIWLYCRKHGIRPICEYTFFDLWWHLPNSKFDSHNGKKAMFDAFEKGKLVSNDKFVMDRTQGVCVDKSDPHVVVEFEAKDADTAGKQKALP